MDNADSANRVTPLIAAVACANHVKLAPTS